MINPRLFWFVWVGLIVYAFFLAPPDNPSETFSLIKRLSTGQWDGINPLIVSLFNVMGIWPMIYAAVMLFDGRGQTVKAYPFTIGSFGVGAFTILPYLALRKPGQPFTGQKSLILKLLDSRWTAGAIALGTIPLVLYGLTLGDWSDFAHQWQTRRFIHVMSLDFCLLWLLFPALMQDDMRRRSVKHPTAFTALAFIPLLGALAYWVVRPHQAESQGETPAPGDRYATASGPPASSQ
ncbi:MULTISPECIES: DUF2834 domain-containing protein [unclassified Leptolyngbya]|uniref:DUF2834 domain-containing protein n=1 Tax=unclassified Leptolyngbya TaxID=2650499 RepID=UPI00168766D5|nr:MULTISPECIES: DUF2834 domain-containing protein [unclassified Leptolyngbya]MBD1911125.1 DUF2834 domain-containing protein [Leptolyngbya sp. FACHB-8]MBD2154324.1 DUF2834 domain-containing protein [Leptolyngbya sp. FACHB-16]